MSIKTLLLWLMTTNPAVLLAGQEQKEEWYIDRDLKASVVVKGDEVTVSFQNTGDAPKQVSRQLMEAAQVRQMIEVQFLPSNLAGGSAEKFWLGSGSEFFLIREKTMVPGERTSTTIDLRSLAMGRRDTGFLRALDAKSRKMRVAVVVVRNSAVPPLTGMIQFTSDWYSRTP